MEELNKTNRLTIIVVAFVLVIVVGLITLRRPDVKYTLTPSESLKLLNNPAFVVTPEQVSALLTDSAGKTIFIDVRNSIAYERGHLNSAVNVPIRELFSKKSKSLFHDIEKAGQIAVIYGETQQQANGPWLMLKQTGFKNILLFTGTYTQLDMIHADSLTRLLPQFSESPNIDTAALKKIATPVSDTKMVAKPAKKEVLPVKKTGSTGGGC